MEIKYSLRTVLQFVKGFSKKHATFWNDPAIFRHMAISIGLVIASLAIIHTAQNYTDVYSGKVVPDLLLDNLPVVNVGYIFFQ